MTLDGVKVTAGLGAAVMVIVRARLPDPPTLVAVMVALKVPATDAVPETTPVLVLTLNPAGRPVAPKLVGALVAAMV